MNDELLLDISIVGAGVVGLTLAIALSQQGLKVALIDSKSVDYFSAQKSMKPYDARIYALNQAAMRLFNSIGMMPALWQSRHAIYRDMILWQKNRLQSLKLSSREHTIDQLGLIVEQSILVSLLWDQLLREHDIKFIEDTTVEAVDSLAGRLVLRNGMCLHSKLIIGADGARSIIRSKLDIVCEISSYDETALVVNVFHSKPHESTAYQCFDGESTLAFLPLCDPHHSSVVWSLSTSAMQAVMDLSDEDFIKQLQSAFDHKLGPISLLNSRQIFPLIKRHVRKYFKDRVVLVGDAAHTIHPMAGLGLNLGLMDVTDLVGCLTSAFKKQKEVGSQKALRRYQRLRSTHASMMLQLMDSLKWGFKNRLPFTWVNHAPWFKRRMINIAQGAYSLPMILQ
ncbi:MAG: FAD-dependent monooxygenase [Gammaproteobacteria bacterium]